MMGQFQSEKKPLTSAKPVSHHFEKMAVHPVKKFEENVSLNADSAQLFILIS